MKKVFMRYILPILGVLAVVFADQWTKYLALTQIGMYNSIVLIENILELRVIPNHGMAWGMLQNQQWLFIIMTPVVLILMAWVYVKMPHEKKFIPMRILEVMLAGGAIGNLLDRMFRGEFCQGYVVDMFYVKAINFPIFNVADSFICVSFALLVVLVLFKYSEEDFDRIFNFTKKKVVADPEEKESAADGLLKDKAEENVKDSDES